MRRSASICMMPSDCAASRVHRDGGDGHIGVAFDVLGDDAPEIHPVKLVAAQDQHVFEIMVQEMDQVFPHGVGRALIPGGVGKGLFGREDFHEAAGEMIELVGLRNVPVQRGGVELGQQIDPLQVRN